MANLGPTPDFKSELISLGFAFYGEASASAADPERTLLKILERLPAEIKTFRMMLAWLEKCRELVHVERLRTLAEELPTELRGVLGAICLKQVNAGDRRFSIVVSWAKKQSQASAMELFHSDEYLESKYGLDLEMSEFGIRTYRIEPSEPKKLLTLPGILEMNPWLRMRALIGSNFRADVAFLMLSKRVPNAYQAAKTLGCNVETSYRLWKALELAPDLEKLVS